MSNGHPTSNPGEVGALLRKLVDLHIPSDRCESALQVAARLLESSLNTAPSLQTTESVTKCMVFRMVRERRHAQASKLASLTSALKYEHGINVETLWPVLYILNDMRGRGDQMNAGAVDAAKQKEDALDVYGGSAGSPPSTEILGESSATAPSDNHASNGRGAVNVSANPFLPGVEPVPQQEHPVHIPSGEEEYDASPSIVLEPRGDRRTLMAVKRASDSVALQNRSMEKSLIQDLLLIVQGENGRLLSFEGDGDEETVRFDLPSGTELPPAVQDMVLSVAECGFLFRIIQRRVEEGCEVEEPRASNQDGESGQVSKNMCRAINQEMDSYYRSLVTLRGVDNMADLEDKGLDGLTLRRVLVWSEGEKPPLRWLARLCEETRPLRGGQILAHLRRRRGSYVPKDIRDMMSRILSSTAAPINLMLVRWLSEGELADSHGEFFIREDPKVAATMMPAPFSAAATIEESGVTSGLAGGATMASLASHRIWWGLFKMRKDMLPGSVNSDLAQKALLAGKSIAFLRRCCSDSAWVDQVHAPLVASLTSGGKKLFEADHKFDKDVVRELIEATKESACKRLKELFFDKFDLSHHFGAIKRYLLLSQGDFAQALMDGLAPILDGDGNILRNNLTGFVDAALQGSSSFNEETDQDILERLDVQIVSQGGPALVGWDVFSLTYRVQDAPLNTVFSEKVMDAYLLIFRFLWRLKRMDYLMTKAYLNLRKVHECRKPQMLENNGVVDTDVADGFKSVVKRVHHLRMKMTHLVHNLQHYCTVEVLEGSWAVLEREMGGAEDLDEMIQAHAKYLTVIKDRTLLSDRSKYVAAELKTVLDTIPRFNNVHMEVCQWVEECELRGELSNDGEIQELQRKLGEIEKSFDESFVRLLKVVAKHTKTVDTCVFLLFRLDFNEYYARRTADTPALEEREEDDSAD